MNERADVPFVPFVVGVRELCEFTAKAGDLDLRFTPAPSAQEGVEGHALVAGRRGPGWQAERSLGGVVGGLRLRGRADGWDAGRGRLEEVKTHKGSLDRQPANHRALHWAQLKVYGALACAEDGLDSIELGLVYFEVASQRETVFTERLPRDVLQAFAETLCARYLDWARREAAHRLARDAALTALTFPHAGFRTGQRPLAEAVFRAARHSRVLLAQAPTGIGKTVGTLFPLLKAMPQQGLDRVFFLTAKSSGRGLALEALQRLAGARDGMPGALPLRSLEMVARDKACEHPDAACHGDSCPLARGFYDRLPAARLAAVGLAAGGTPLRREPLRALAAQHAVCPYYLSQELARWADVVVGDYHYWFDRAALLHALAASQQWQVGLLVDEAHNLVERGRGMYSATLDQAALQALRKAPPPGLKKPLDVLQRRWKALNAEHPAPYQVLPALPEPLMDALDAVNTAIAEHFSAHPAEPLPALQTFWFSALGFAQLAEAFDRHSLLDLSLQPGPRGQALGLLCLRNVVPAPFLRPRLLAARTATLFSATLQPEAYYRDLLGLPADAVALDVESPFQADQLQVRVAGHISTRWPERAASVPAIVALMARQYAQRPGNYLAFFSSHDYLAQVADAFAAAHPQVPTWRQGRGMAEAAQQAFLDRFVEDGQGIAFAVLGGSFGEGVDLPGTRLIGAFVATLGLPQVNPVQEQMRARLDELLDAGYDYTYVVPGLQKVVQAAGRVIRGVSDEGVLHLIDDRYGRAAIRRLLPTWWRVQQGARD